MSVNMPTTAPGKPLSSIMSSSVRGSGTSLKSIWKDVQAANPNMSKQEQMRTAKTLRQLAVDPSKITSKGKMKSAISALSATGRLKTKYKDRHSAAIREIKKQHKELQEEKIKDKSILTQQYDRERMIEDQKAKDAAHGAGALGKGPTRNFGREQMMGAKVSAVNQIKRNTVRAESEQDEEEALDIMID